jgi:hypothetical protein
MSISGQSFSRLCPYLCSMTVHVPPKFPRPVEGDCEAYFFRYINKVTDPDIVNAMQKQQAVFSDFIAGLSPDQLHFRYAPEKWSLAEMIGHVLDTERIFAYRMFCISRGEHQNLPGFEQDDYVEASIFDYLNGNELKDEWNAIRTSTIMLCQHMTTEMAARLGKANGVPVRAYAYAYMMVGHVVHHLEIAAERYLQPA